MAEKKGQIDEDDEKADKVFEKLLFIVLIFSLAQFLVLICF